MNCLIKCNASCDREVLKVGENLWPAVVPGKILKQACSELAHEDSRFRVLTLPSNGSELLREYSDYLERQEETAVIGDFYIMPLEKFQRHHIPI